MICLQIFWAPNQKLNLNHEKSIAHTPLRYFSLSSSEKPWRRKGKCPRTDETVCLRWLACHWPVWDFRSAGSLSVCSSRSFEIATTTKKTFRQILEPPIEEQNLTKRNHEKSIAHTPLRYFSLSSSEKLKEKGEARGQTRPKSTMTACHWPVWDFRSRQLSSFKSFMR